MIDIETLGTKPGCPILSLGAVEFDTRTGKTGKKFYENLSLKSNLEEKLKIDPDTLKWWFSQSYEARNVLFKNEIDLKNALDLFSEFVNFKYEVWGNSARFDFGILEYAYNKIKMPLPWYFWQENDVRTISKLRPEIKKNFIHRDTKHIALSDCYRQIGYLTKTLAHLNS